MKILGLSFGFHDASASIIVDGEFIAGTSEERFSRIKNDKSFPINAIEFCLDHIKSNICDIDQIVYYEDNTLKFDRICNSSLKNNDIEYLMNTIDSWIERDSFNIEQFISDRLCYPISNISYTTHHQAHAASAFYQSPFEKAAILTIDGIGEYETTGMFYGNGNNLEKIKTFGASNSIGLLYSAFTAFIGFKVNEGEYKVMGMSAFGKPKYVDKILTTVKIGDLGEVIVDSDYYNFSTPKQSLYTDKFLKVFGIQRDESIPFFTDSCASFAPDYLTDVEKRDMAQYNQYYADIAASIQSITMTVISKLSDTALKMCNTNLLCLSGGAALNSVANGLLRNKKNIEDLFIQPNSGDAGSSLGAALYYAHNIKRIDRVKGFNSCYKGMGWERAAIEKTIEEHKVNNYSSLDDEDVFFDKVSDLLLDENVLGLLSGRAEWGPRALGARSIIANPSFPNIQSVVNSKIKFREAYRPFAPSVLAEFAKEWFEIDGDLNYSSPESFMLTVAKVKEDKKEQIPSVVHADGTARVQLVWSDISPDYHKLIKSFYDKTGIPIILNTSFNLKGEPIVNSPEDALMTFSYCDMDFLIMKPFIIGK